MAEVPLATLLSWAWTAFAIEADNAVEAAGSDRVGRLFRISLATWANGLRRIGEEGVTVDELQAQTRAACNIGGLERWGWISVGDPGTGRRDGYGSHRGVKGTTVLRPTRAGDDVSLSGLMGQALTALTLEHERGSAVSLPLGALPWHPMALHRGGWPDGA